MKAKKPNQPAAAEFFAANVVNVRGNSLVVTRLRRPITVVAGDTVTVSPPSIQIQ